MSLALHEIRDVANDLMSELGFTAVDQLRKYLKEYDFGKSPEDSKEAHAIMLKMTLRDSLLDGSLKFTSETNNVSELTEEEKNELRNDLANCYFKIIDVLKYYCDLDEDWYPVVATWIVGTYLHSQFQTYPYLFLNAMKGSGKTRLLRLISKLAWKGEICNSMTEAVLFRTQGTLAIDEFEGLTRKGGENLRELLNSCYKKGSKVKRMRKKSGPEGEEQVVEEFETYRPVVMANIWGMEEVLGDRCITIIIDKTTRPEISRLVENFDDNEDILQIVRTLGNLFGTTTPETTLTPKSPNLAILSRKNGSACSLCSFMSLHNVYRDWNNFIKNKTNNYTTTQTYNYTKLHDPERQELFDKVYNSEIDGRNLEISIPLFFIANFLDKSIFDDILKIVKKIVANRKTEEFTENKDVSVIDFVSQQEVFDEFKSITSLTNQFRIFLQEEVDDLKWVNTRWLGKSLKRLNLILEKKRMNNGVSVVLDVAKAKDKIKMFKSD